MSHIHKVTLYTLQMSAPAESPPTPGDERLASIHTTLELLGPDRSQQQIQFHDSLICACLPVIRGGGGDPEHTIKYPETPRRFGRTRMMAMFVVALSLHVPGIKLAVFTEGRRADNAFKLEIREMLQRVPGGESAITTEHTPSTTTQQQ